MKFFRFFCQTLIVLLLIGGFFGCTSSNDELRHATSTQHDGKNNTEVNSVETASSIITYLKEKRDYLWFFVVVIAVYFAYRANTKANKLAKDISELKPVKKSINEDKDKKYWLAAALPKILVFIAILSIVTTMLVLGFYFSYFDGSITTESDRWGHFGDFLGGTLNSIFGFLGLIALLFTIILQSRELQLSRQELRMSVGSSQAQNNTFKRQQFENTFFHLLNLHNTIVNSLELSETYLVESITRGRECLAKCDEIFKEEKYLDRYEPDNVKALPKMQQEKFLEESFKEFLFYMKTRYHLSVEHYFVHLCNMIAFLGKDEAQVFISESGEDKKAKQHYMNIIRSQLSEAERSLLFFYCLSHSSDECCQLMMEYGLLQNAQEVELANAKYCEYYHDERVLIDDS